MTIDLVFITYNRLEYTKLALASVLADPEENFSLTIWDNASTDGTVEYLKNNTSDNRIVDVIFSKENIGQIEAVNQIWSKSKADLLGKLDNDCIVTPGWTRKLSEAHKDIHNLGVVACWHFPKEDFNENAVKKAGKLQQFNRHQIMRHPWTCGTGFLVKRETYERFGPIQGNVTTNFWLKIASSGYINGFYYPLICQEHMDDPKSSHSILKDDESIGRMQNITSCLREHNVKNMQDRWRIRETILDHLNNGPWEAKYYMGWRRKVRLAKKLILNISKPGH